MRRCSQKKDLPGGGQDLSGGRRKGVRPASDFGSEQKDGVRRRGINLPDFRVNPRLEIVSAVIRIIVPPLNLHIIQILWPACDTQGGYFSMRAGRQYHRKSFSRSVKRGLRREFLLCSRRARQNTRFLFAPLKYPSTP